MINMAGNDKLATRLSNIELLRIISMFGVLIVHSDFGALGYPTSAELTSTPGYTIIRTFVEAFAIVAVNVFVLISGWFGINFKWGGLCRLLFQCAFFFFGIYIVLSILGLCDISIKKGIYMCLMLSDNAWFVKSYLGMFVFAPVMNIFIKNAQRNIVEIFLISFFVFQSIYGWISSGATYISNGYSAFSFMGLYMLARYVRIYNPTWSRFSIRKDLAIYAILSTISTIGMLIGIYFDQFIILVIFCKYSSILIIGAALFLLLAFTKFHFTSKVVNKIAASCFAVYLLHFIIFPKYMSPWIKSIAENNNAIVEILLIIVTLLLFYASAIIIDQIRLFLWNRLLARFFK